MSSCKYSFLDLWLISALKSICSSLSSADGRHYTSTGYCTFKIISSLVVNLPLREENTKMLSSEYWVSIQSSSAAQKNLQPTGKKIKGLGRVTLKPFNPSKIKKPTNFPWNHHSVIRSPSSVSLFWFYLILRPTRWQGTNTELVLFLLPIFSMVHMSLSWSILNENSARCFQLWVLMLQLRQLRCLCFKV